MSIFGIKPGELSTNERRAWPRRLVAVLGWTAVGAYFAAAAVVLGLRYWLLPNITHYSGFIEQAVSRTIGERVAQSRGSAFLTHVEVVGVLQVEL